MLALDADGAGQEAMLRAARVAEGRALELRVVPLPAGLDPADLVQPRRGPTRRARWSRGSIPNSWLPLWKTSPSLVLRYFGGWFSRIARAPKPTTRPRASASGNMIRSRKRS